MPNSIPSVVAVYSSGKRPVTAIKLITGILLSLLTYSVISEDDATREIPLLYSTNDDYTGILRFINHGKEIAEVRIVGIDDAGMEHGPATITLGSQENRIVYVDELENGDGPIKDGLGRGTGSWRIFATGPRNIEVSSFAEAQDGFLTSLQETVRGENGCWRVPIFYSADNLTQSRLRISNRTNNVANIKISGRDDNGRITSKPISLGLGSYETQSFTAEQLEEGDVYFDGLLGDGKGNWQLAIESDQPLNVMSLLEGQRRVSNLSSRPSYALGHCWLGKSLANADRSIGKRIQYIVERNLLEDTLPLSPAVYAAIVDETGVRAISALGVKNFETREEASVHDKIYLSSATKPMTALMIATLVHEESSVFKDGWETTLASVFSDSLETIHEDYHDATMRDLLTHVSGVQVLPVELEQGSDEGDLSDRRLTASLATLAIPRQSIPSQVHYSHAGYMVAGAAAEKLTGNTYENLMHERVFEPLGMASAGFGLPNLEDPSQPSGHKLATDPNLAWVPDQQDFRPVLNPAGGIHITMEDWGKFLQLWMNAKEPMLLNKGALQELTRLGVRNGTLLKLEGGGSNAGGWWLYPSVFGFGESLNHPGSNGNWYTMVWVMRETSRAYLVSINSTLPNAVQTRNQIVTPAITQLMTSTARSSPPVPTSATEN